MCLLFDYRQQIYDCVHMARHRNSKYTIHYWKYRSDKCGGKIKEYFEECNKTQCTSFIQQIHVWSRPV